MAKFIEVAQVNEVPDQSAKCVEVEGRSIALFNLEGEFYALDNTCPHSGGALCEGDIVNGEIECPLHNSTFDIKTGEVIVGPADEDVLSYPVRIVEEAVEVEIEG